MRALLALLIIALLILIFMYFLVFQGEKEKEVLEVKEKYWPMFKHDVYRTGNLFGERVLKELKVGEMLQIGENLGLHTTGSNAPESYANRKILDKNDSFDPSPIFVDLDLDGIDEVITYYKSTAYNITTGERPFVSWVMAVKYKEKPSELEKLAFGELPFIMWWRFILPCDIHTSFAASDLNNDDYPEIAFGCDDGNLYVLSYKGGLLFKFKTKDKVRSSPAVADIDLDKKPEIVFGSDDGYLYVLDKNGNLKWKFKANDRIQSSPTIFVANESRIVFGSDDGYLYVLDKNGNEVCSYKTGGKIRSSPLIYDNKIVFGSDDGNIYLLDLNCNLIKTYKTGGKVRSSPALYKNYFVVGSEDGNLYIFNENEIKNISLDTPVFSTPVSVKDKILVPNFDGKFYLVDETGKEIIFELNMTKNFSCSPSVGIIKKSMFSCFYVKFENSDEFSSFFIQRIDKRV